MFPRGQLSGQDEPYNSEPLPLSPKRQDLQKRSQSPTAGQSLYRKLPKEPKENYDLQSVATSGTEADLASPGENRSSDCQDGSGVMENPTPRASEKIQNDEEKEKSEDQEGEEGSGNIVEHILKELKGINKIQEEISDLRQYLSSVRGSVDEVSCCVDAVLSEIGELYSGASAAPHPSPVSQAPRIRQGSLGRQDAVSSPHNRSPLMDHKDFGNDSGYMSSHRSPKQWIVDQANLRSVQQTDQENSEQNSNMHMLSHTNPDLCYMELHYGCNYQSSSSLSSYLSSNCLDAGSLSGQTEYERWPSADMQHSISREGGWSEEDISSCANSREELQNYLRVWNRCATEETQSSTPGHSSHNSSEHLSLLFGQHYDSPSHSSSVVDWRPLRKQTEEENLECDCAANCPFSRSSGYHTMDACPNEHGSGPSRSLSCSTVLLTDCDDGNLEPHSPCDDCPSSGDTLDLGSVESLDREWTDPSISREDAEESLSQESSEIDTEGAPKNPNVGFDVTTFSKAVLTFRSALKGALKKLEGSNPEVVEEESGIERSLSLTRQASDPKEEQGSDVYTEGEASLTENQTQFATPKEESDNSVYMDCEMHENLSDSLQASSHDGSCSPHTPAERHTLQISQGKVEYLTHVELSNIDHSPARQAESPLGPLPSTDELRLSPIRENHVLDQANEEKPTDASHKERIANFQRILREKRQTRHRLSRSTQGSVGSHGSQGSQGSQSLDEFIPGIY
ncbi:uncharacterized protein LOC124996645 [Mugil cephalus]|uniref:uncharacterized protein LOC124996645 n=1 Tax=Mugil cephalus TaxID=48193 RepID=UPI001FB824C4|nr:uncharacterized protein LOC124996645 [Mugil cephalus]